jgi:adenine-specific DNA-methyltransferase
MRTVRYILVQLPEPLDAESKAQSAAARYCDKKGKPRFLSELTKERLRSAALQIKADFPHYSGDLGFRVFRLDSSNIVPWQPQINALDRSLLDAVDHIQEGRGESDIFFELLLKLGLDLSTPVASKRIGNRLVQSVGAGTLIACLDDHIGGEDVEALAHGIVDWHRALAPSGETHLLFRDSAFADDVSKANLTAIFSQHGLANVKSL